MSEGRVCAALLVVAACALPLPASATPSSSSSSPSSSSSAAALTRRFECHRCHETPLARPPRLSQDCRGCHQGIVDGRIGRGGDGARWLPHVEDLAAVPSLKQVKGRLRPSFVRAFLLDPDGVGDVRPHLRQAMPRLPLTDAEAAVLATALAGPEPAAAPPPDDAAIERGRARFASLGCTTCHAFSGVTSTSTPAGASREGGRARWLAPDLAFARRRLVPSFVAAFIENPRAHDPHTPMPDLNVSATDARDLAAFIFGAPLTSSSSSSSSRRPTVASLPVIARPVAWAEVRQRVIETSCWHCHQTPAGGSNDGGPGVAGGFGFGPRGIDLTRHDGVVDGAVGLLEREPVTGASRLVAALLARHHEVDGGRVVGVTGMPLGLPPLSLDDIALVQAWVVQGARVEATGQ